MRAALTRLLRGCLPQHAAAPVAHEVDTGPVLAYLWVGAPAAEIIRRFAEPTIRVQVRNWTVVISLSHEGRLYSAAVEGGRIVALRCQYTGGVPDGPFQSAEAARFLPRDGEEMHRVIFRTLGDGWLLALRQGERATGEALGVAILAEPEARRDADRRYRVR
jgi:hypothetical protein